MDTDLILEERKGQLWIIEDNLIKCSRLIMPSIKGPCEANWKENHKKFMELVRQMQNGVQMQKEEKADKVDDVAVGMGTPILA